MNRQEEKSYITLEELTDGIVLDFQGTKYLIPDELAMKLAQGIATILRNRKTQERNSA